MNFNDTAKAPVIITVGKETLRIPKFLRSDWKAWAAEIDARRLEEATKGMTPEQRFTFVAFHAIPPTTAEELRVAAVATLAGQEKIVRTCLGKLGWSDERIGDFIDANEPEDIQLLAVQLASIRPRVPLPMDQSQTKQDGPEGEKGSDPRPPSDEGSTSD